MASFWFTCFVVALIISLKERLVQKDKLIMIKSVLEDEVNTFEGKVTFVKVIIGESLKD